METSDMTETVCEDRECRWFSETNEHYVVDHEQMDEIEEQERVR